MFKHGLATLLLGTLEDGSYPDDYTSKIDPDEFNRPLFGLQRNGTLICKVQTRYLVQQCRPGKNRIGSDQGSVWSGADPRFLELKFSHRSLQPWQNFLELLDFDHFTSTGRPRNDQCWSFLTRACKTVTSPSYDGDWDHNTSTNRQSELRWIVVLRKTKQRSNSEVGLIQSTLKHRWTERSFVPISRHIVPK